MPSLEPRHRGCQCFVCPHQMLMREPRGARGPIEWPNIASVLAVDEQTVAFGDYNRETASHRATLAPVDNCADVDKMCLPPGRIGGRAYAMGGRSERAAARLRCLTCSF